MAGRGESERQRRTWAEIPRLVALAALVATAFALVACGSDGTARRSAPTGGEDSGAGQLVDHGPPSPSNWTVVQTGRTGGRSWKLLRGTSRGNECFRMTATPDLPPPSRTSCNLPASLTSDFADPMTLDLAEVGSGAGYVYGGVAPQAATVKVVRKDGSRVDVHPVHRTLVHYLEAIDEIARLSFTTSKYQVDCVTGTPAMLFNCSAGPPGGVDPAPIRGPCPGPHAELVPSGDPTLRDLAWVCR